MQLVLAGIKDAFPHFFQVYKGILVSQDMNPGYTRKSPVLNIWPRKAEQGHRSTQICQNDQVEATVELAVV